MVVLYCVNLARLSYILQNSFLYMLQLGWVAREILLQYFKGRSEAAAIFVAHICCRFSLV